MPVIQDQAGNPLQTQSSPMIGYVPIPSVEEPLRMEMYRFLIEGIRIADQNEGGQFVERYLEGPQQIWRDITQNIRNLPLLWDIPTVSDSYLEYQKNIVGWTAELDHITDRLDSDTLRRLIIASVPFWKKRGTENSIIDLMKLVTGARVRIWNWFDFRIVMDGTALTEDREGYDPHMISLPGPPNYDENRYNIRIVDDGTLDHALVRELAKLTRPVNERVVISYLGFLDLFTIESDNSQWEDGTNSESTVSGGVLTLNDPAGDTETHVGLEAAPDWTNYTATWKIRSNTSSMHCYFYRTGDNDYYLISLFLDDHATTPNTVVLSKSVGGVDTVLQTVDLMATYSMEIKTDMYYAVRVEIIPESTYNIIRLYIDAVQIVDTTDSSHASGSLGVGQTTGTEIELSELEMFFNPMETDTIDINT